jgi:hypothetical protein
MPSAAVGGPGGGTLIDPQRPRIGIDGALGADLLGRNQNGICNFRRCAPILGATSASPVPPNEFIQQFDKSGDCRVTQDEMKNANTDQKVP